MKMLMYFLAPFVLSCVLVACGQPTGWIMQERARAGLDAALAELPQSSEFQIYRVVYSKVLDIEGRGSECYYGRGYAVIGSSLLEREAIISYFQMVQSSGWISEGEQYNVSKLLKRGLNERMELYVGDPDVDIKDAVKSVQLRNGHQSLVYVRVDYMLPSRDQC